MSLSHQCGDVRGERGFVTYVGVDLNALRARGVPAHNPDVTRLQPECLGEDEDDGLIRLAIDRLRMDGDDKRRRVTGRAADDRA